MKKVSILDTSLRDGNHTVNNRFDLKDIASICNILDQARVDYVEVGYGYGLGSFSESGYPNDEEIINTALDNLSYSKLALLVFPDKANISQLKEILDLDIGLIRIATQATNVEPAKEFIELVKDSDIQIGGFMMMASRASIEELIEEGLKLKEYGADSITLTDSAGAMMPEQVEDAISSLKEAVNLPIGFHTHDSLGLAVGNSLTAIEAGAGLIDSALAGLGAGGGNTKTETLIAALNKSQYQTDARLYQALDGVKELAKIVNKYDIEIEDDESGLMVGYTDVYSTFTKLVNQIAEKYNISPRRLLEEVGREKLIPGQEAKIEDLAKNIKENKI